MPKKCGNCGGDIGPEEEAVHCDDCKLPYHEDCRPDKCLRCDGMM